MFTLTAFEAALRGDEAPLAREAGPGGIVRVAGELASVLVAPEAADHVVLGWRRDREVEVTTVGLPARFRVRDIVVEDGQFVLTGVNGRFVRGAPDLFTTFPQIPDTFLQGPVADLELTNVAQIAEAGEAVVPIDDVQIWVSFMSTDAKQIVAMVPQARELLASFETLGHLGAEYLLARMTAPGGEEHGDEDGGDEEFDEAEFLEDMVPTSLVVHPTGEFDIHFEGPDGKYFLDGYWPSVQFTPAGKPVDFAIEA